MKPIRSVGFHRISFVSHGLETGSMSSSKLSNEDWWRVGGSEGAEDEGVLLELLVVESSSVDRSEGEGVDGRVRPLLNFLPSTASSLTVIIPSLNLPVFLE